MKVTNKQKNELFTKKLKNNLAYNNNAKSYTKEPNDSNSKEKINNNKKRIVSYLLNKIPLNTQKNTNVQTKKCEFCNSNVEDLVVHYQYYHLKKNNQLIMPKKRDTALLNEKLNDNNTDEMGIDENKKQILLREFKLNKHSLSIDFSNKNNNILTSQKTEKKKNFFKPEKIEKLTFNKIFEYNVKYEKKNFPEDNINVMKSQERNSKHKKFIQFENENYNKSEDKSPFKNKNEFNNVYSPQIKTSHINFGEDCFNPLFYFTEARRNNINLTEGLDYNTPNISYINLIDNRRKSFDNNSQFINEKCN